MNIHAIKPIAIRLPMKKPVIMAGEEIHVADNVLVRIDAGGHAGWGEAASAPTMTGETLASMVTAIELMTPILIGRDPRDLGGAMAAMNARLYGNSGAKAAIEMALYDLIGRATGQPVHALLGRKIRDRMALLGVVGGGDRDGDLADAASKKADGYTAFKIKVGIDSAANDAARTRDICKVLGRGLLISADANQGFNANDAQDYVRAVNGCGLDFFEQPVDAHDLDGMAAVAGAADGIAIGADEGIHSLDDIRRHHDRGAANGVSLKTIKLGGLRGVVEAGRLCDRLGMSVNIAGKTGESSIASAAALHIAAVIPNIAWALTLTSPALREDVTAVPLRGSHGYAGVIDRPGLGIEVDDARVAAHRIG
jgi:muconate cycloisomerase